LVRDPEIVEFITTLFAERGRVMSPNNARQADVPQGASIIPQRRGTAPGLICPVGHKVIYCVPGVPYEMQEMFERAILPDLEARAAARGETAVIRSRVLRTWGAAESTLAEVLDAHVQELENSSNVTLAYLASGIVNLMALGGDAPTHPDAITGELTYASELVALARSVGAFSIGVAAHPDGHPRSRSMTADRDRLAEKLSMADFAVTQMLFEADRWSALVEDLHERGVDKPVLPGIMPVTTLGAVDRMAQMGSVVPTWLVERLQRAHAEGGDAAVRAAGIDLATDLCSELLQRGVPGLHFYTLNLSTATREITERLATR